MRSLYCHYRENRQDRIAITNLASFSTNVLTGIGQLLLGIFLFSAWHVINSVYRLLLCAAKGQTLQKYSNTIEIKNESEKYDAELAVHKRGGLFICLLGTSYLVICLWMLFAGDVQVQHAYYRVYGMAVVSFTRMGFAIRGIIVARHMSSPIASLFKKISFLDALVSIVITQCTLLTMMEVNEAVSSSALLGIGVSILFIALGTTMLIGKKSLSAQKASKNEERSSLACRQAY